MYFQGDRKLTPENEAEYGQEVVIRVLNSFDCTHNGLTYLVDDNCLTMPVQNAVNSTFTKSPDEKKLQIS